MLIENPALNSYYPDQPKHDEKMNLMAAGLGFISL
jgi:hypothetical protein